MDQPGGGEERKVVTSTKAEAEQKGSGPVEDRVQYPDPITEAGPLLDESSALDENHIEIESGKSVNALNRSKKSVRWSQELVTESPIPRTMSSDDHRSSPYVVYSSASANDNPSSSNFKNTMETVKDALGRWRKRVGEATKKAEDIAGNTWQHLKTGPSLADAALGRLAQGTKVLAEGGYEKIFRQTFETVPEEQLQDSFACYLSTSAGPVMGILYVSTAKLAFCSDNPLSYKASDKTEWSYYKIYAIGVVKMVMVVLGVAVVAYIAHSHGSFAKRQRRDRNGGGG
ncbi:unnamed protein product [Cuscuta europaea]|uniref:GRAM domain-containing protein n=1 Tax=Cuscuta europaea TaxID=41803 RepID=A0A9P0Z5F1_CUSEU|nr:unnamed protein product [Cuscuta europaea]